ncbi:unnamed protein product [Ixodes hexagonus]
MWSTWRPANLTEIYFLSRRSAICRKSEVPASRRGHNPVAALR